MLLSPKFVLVTESKVCTSTRLYNTYKVVSYEQDWIMPKVHNYMHHWKSDFNNHQKGSIALQPMKQAVWPQSMKQAVWLQSMK